MDFKVVTSFLNVRIFIIYKRTKNRGKNTWYSVLLIGLATRQWPFVKFRHFDSESADIRVPIIPRGIMLTRADGTTMGPNSVHYGTEFSLRNNLLPGCSSILYWTGFKSPVELSSCHFLHGHLSPSGMRKHHKAYGP